MAQKPFIQISNTIHIQFFFFLNEMSTNELAKKSRKKTVLEMRIFRNKNWGLDYNNPCHDLNNFWEINRHMRLRAKQNMQVEVYKIKKKLSSLYTLVYSIFQQSHCILCTKFGKTCRSKSSTWEKYEKPLKNKF